MIYNNALEVIVMFRRLLIVMGVASALVLPQAVTPALSAGDRPTHSWQPDQGTNTSEKCDYLSNPANCQPS
jgi:hypothetical protein